MIVLALLLAGLGLTGVAAHRLLNAPWTAQSPASAIGLWQVLVAAATSSALWLGATAVESVQHVRLDVGHLLHACLVSATDGLQHRSVLATSAVGGLAALALLRLATAGLAQVSRARRARRAQRDLLDVVCLRDEAGRGEVHVLPGEQPLAYCVPGGGGRIVLSTGARQVLDADELDAVVAHERAHLRGRHHLLVLPFHALRAAAPRSRTARRAEEALATLVEMAADDRACKVAPRERLASALIKLSAPDHPRAALAATGGATTARVLRLLDQPRLTAPEDVAPLGISALMLLSLPWLAAGVPVTLALTGHCLG